MTHYLLTREDCNGEYGDIVHRSLHRTIQGAKKKHKKILDKGFLKGEDATNKWTKYGGDHNGGDPQDKGVLEFRTGNWGYIVYKITPLELED